MDQFIDSNERTLVIFDAVCAGLADCLALVHADIKQMTEHRNKLAQLELQEQQDKIDRITTSATHETLINKVKSSRRSTNQHDGEAGTDHDLAPRTRKHHDDILQQQQHHESEEIAQDERDELSSVDEGADGDDDPHNLTRLKLLDKRLADSFSQALSMCDQQKSSLASKSNRSRSSSSASNSGSRPGILQILLGKSSKGISARATSDNNKGSGGRSATAALKKHNSSSAAAATNQRGDNELCHRVMIDDINRQTRLAMQYSKQLESNLFKVEDLRVKYEMHLKMGLELQQQQQQQQQQATLLTSKSSSSLTKSASSLSLKRLHKLNKNSGHKYDQYQHQNYYNQHQHHQYQPQHVMSNVPVAPSAFHNQCHQHFQNDFTLTTSINAAAAGAATCGDHLHPGNILGSNSSSSLTKSPSTLSLRRFRSKSHLMSSTSSSSSSSARAIVKEFMENIDRLEREFESYMGTFLLTIEDIQGFARVCQGDVFEVNIKYGDAQKFKTKISVLKDSRQKCDNRQVVFKAKIADCLAIKAHECKGLGKKVLLGHKLCETRDFFTARSQLMTISLNQTGSIKLNMIITWNPLHMAPNSSLAVPGLDISHISLPPTPVSSSTLSSLSSTGLSLVNGQGSGSSSCGGATTTTINIQSDNNSYRRNQMLQQQQRNNSPHPGQATDHENHHNHRHHHHQSARNYCDVDPNYGYYIPEPDYVQTNEYRF